MSLTKYERGSTFRTRQTYVSGTTNVNCSGNLAYLTVYKPDGTTYIDSVSGSHVGTGIYEYYVSTSSTDLLGIWVCEWKGYFNYDAPWYNEPKVDRECIQLVYVK